MMTPEEFDASNHAFATGAFWIYTTMLGVIVAGLIVGQIKKRTK